MLLRLRGDNNNAVSESSTNKSAERVKENDRALFLRLYIEDTSTRKLCWLGNCNRDAGLICSQ